MHAVARELSELQAKATELWGFGTSGHVLLCTLALALFSLLGVVPGAIRARWVRFFGGHGLALATAILVAAVGVCIASIAIERGAELQRALGHSSSASHSLRYSASAMWADRAMHVTALCVLVAVPVLLVAALRLFPRATTRSFLAVAALLCAAAAYGTLELSAAYAEPRDYWSGNMDPDARKRSLEADLMQAQSVLTFWTRVLPVLSLVGIAACAIPAMRDAGRGYVVSRRAALASAFCFATGVAVFAATRGSAADARRVIPLRPVPNRCPSEAAVTPMNVGRCQPLMEAPLVLFGRDGYVIDGSLIRLDSELIAALGNKVDLWKQINPGKSFPGRLVAVASGETLARALVLAHLHDLGFHHIQLVTHMPRRRVATATVGTVDLGSTCCGVEVELDSEGVHLALDTTYADLVRVAREARERHSVLRIAR